MATPEAHPPNPRPVPALEVADLHLDYGGAEVLRGATLEVTPGTVLALLGPSGCGKTTLLRCIAGLETPASGVIAIAGRQVHADGIHVRAEQRGVGMVFQGGALFPHLSVGANVAFGLPRGGRRAQAHERLLDFVGLEGYGDRRPDSLSGGEQQRVALARALAGSPRLLLLDEPFANLDPSLRIELRRQVGTLLRSISAAAVIVTHDQEEALALGDQVAVLHDGKVEQQGPGRTLYESPRTPWLATFVGEGTLLEGAASRGTALTSLGAVAVDPHLDGPCTLLFRPQDLSLSPGGDWRVEFSEYRGYDNLVRVRRTSSPRGTLPEDPGHPPIDIRCGEGSWRAGDLVTPRPRTGPYPAWPRGRATELTPG